MAKLKKINKSFFTDILRSVFFGIILSFALILIFAVFVKAFSLSEAVISPVNAAIKTFCILVGTLLGINDRQLGLVKGLFSGVLYILLSFLIFALLDGGFANAHFSVFDLLLGVIIGIIAGITKVNLKPKTA